MEEVYSDKAYEIIKNSVKSAVFIDEKARGFYSEASNPIELEEKLSIELFENFKSNGISLGIHKYAIKDEEDESLKEYLFDDRDLVLLDWKLNATSGEEFSLKFLSEIVEKPHIHFCAIYTSDTDKDLENIFANILSYFSGDDISYYTDLKEEIQLIDGIEEIVQDLHYINLNRDEKSCGKIIGKIFAENKEIVKSIVEITDIVDTKCALIKASISLFDTVKSPKSNPCPTVSSFSNKTLVIGNTIITILNKNDNKPEDLLKNLSYQITNQESSFMQLLGLNMQTLISKSSSFIDEELLSVSKEALIYHRENYKKEGLQHFFPEFIKEILLEKVNLSLRSELISLLDDDFLDAINEDSIPVDEELIKINVFFNSKKKEHGSTLNFGDVFKRVDVEKVEYFICITALCDCLRPEKIYNTFFFAKGTPIDKKQALKLGDTAFISYLNDKEIIKWTDVNTLISQDEQKYSPVYIKPIPFVVPKNEINQNPVDFYYLDKNGSQNLFQADYITTIKANYCQRIANHAFSYPVRVGVDFVKK